MGNNWNYLLFLIPIAFFAFQIYKSRKNDLIKIKNSFGTVKPKEYIYEEFISIANGFYHQLDNNYAFMNKEEDFTSYVDDITWNDFDMDNIYKQIDSTYSSLGQEELYRILRFTNVSDKELAERRRIMDYFTDNPDQRVKICSRYKNFGFSRKMCIADYIEGLSECNTPQVLPQFIHIVLLVASLVYCLGFNVVAGLWAVIIVSAFNIITYYQKKAQIDNYFLCIKQFYSMCALAKQINRLNISGIEEYSAELSRLLDVFKPVRHFSFIMSSGKGNILEFVLDYVRMLTHLDLIKFYLTVNQLEKQKRDVMALYRTLGYIDSLIAVASYRASLEYYCEPAFAEGTSVKEIEIVDMYHPLINNPVVNSIKSDSSILITGSNASGKSTFLRGVGINILFAQTLGYTFAREYRANRFSIYSSMALKDNLMGHESYYMVEIKSLKRIMDATKTSDLPIVCFIDEVLRGTNTIERIAASSQILKSLSENNCICFAATHDIELTSILEKYYVNYHFTENIIDDDILFEYKIHDGKATSRNAIKLLGLLGYEESILANATKEAQAFEDSGNWSSLL